MISGEEMYTALMESEDDLQQYGVPGMKWGVRRDSVSGQKRESALKRAKTALKTIANRIRKAQNATKKVKNAMKTSDKLNESTKTNWQKTYKRRGTYSDEELKKLVERIRLENQLKEELNKAYPQKQRIVDADLIRTMIKKSPELMKEGNKLYKTIKGIDDNQGKGKKDNKEDDD